MKVVSALVLIGIISSSASAMNIRRGFKFGGGDTNVDGTVVIKKPTLSRGKYVYPITASSGAEQMCRTLGYRNYLPGSLISFWSRGVNSGQVAELDSDGTFFQYRRASSYPAISEVICYNSKRHLLKINDKDYNDDGSITIYKPQLSRGKYTYDVTASSGYDNLCRSMGFGGYMPDSGLSYWSRGVNTGQVVELESDGTFFQYRRASSYPAISEITCFGDNHVDLIIDENGTEYISKSGNLLSVSNGTSRPHRPITDEYTPIPNYDSLLDLASGLRMSIARLEMLAESDKIALSEQIGRMEKRAHVKVETQVMINTLVYLEGLFTEAEGSNRDTRVSRSLRNMKSLVKNARLSL